MMDHRRLFSVALAGTLLLSGLYQRKRTRRNRQLGTRLRVQKTQPAGQAFILVATVKPGDEHKIAEELRELSQQIGSKNSTLQRLTRVHFARFVLIPPPDEEPYSGKRYLAFQTIYDGSLEEHLQEFFDQCGIDLNKIFSCCEDYTVPPPGAIPYDFLRKYQRLEAVAYRGGYGLTARQIRADHELRQLLEQKLDELRSQPSFSQRSAKDIWEQLRDTAIKNQVKLCHVDRHYPVPEWEALRFGSMVCLPVWSVYLLLSDILSVRSAPAVRSALALLLLLPAVIRAVEIRDDRTVAKPPAEPKWDLFAREENLQEQTPLTHIVPIKDSLVRRWLLRAVLHAVSSVASRWQAEGTLGGIGSIHFAQWIRLDDDRLLFFSNYDGSWESYLGDFIAKASKWLTAIWTNTEGFPSTQWLILKGASQGQTFKQWTRGHQIPTTVWYGAYPDLTVNNVLDNAKIREGLVAKNPSTESIQTCLRLL
jgi:hypothetical protein